MSAEIEDIDPRDEIAQLETQIEALAETIDRARKFVVAARVAMTAGGLLLAAILLGVIRFDPATVMLALSAVIGGIVVFGSNTSTTKQAVVEMKRAEARRAALIGGLDLHLVTGERDR